MKKINYLRRLIISLLMLSCFEVYGSSQTMIMEGLFVDDIIWSSDGQKILVKPINESPYLIYKKEDKWYTQPLGLSIYSKFFVWSNKGDKFLYWDKGNIYIYQFNKNPVLLCEATESTASWSFDDKWILFSYNDNIWMMQNDNKQKVKVTKKSIKEASYPQWIDSKTIMFYGIKPKQGSTIWKVDLGTGEPKMINNQIDCYYGGWPIEPNGIPFIDIDSFDIKLLSYNGKVRDLTINGNGIDGKTFVRYHNDSLFYIDNYRNLILVNVKNMENRVVMKEVDRASISPDGKYLAYTSGKKFYIINLQKFE